MKVNESMSNALYTYVMSFPEEQRQKEFNFVANGIAGSGSIAILQTVERFVLEDLSNMDLAVIIRAMIKKIEKELEEN